MKRIFTIFSGRKRNIQIQRKYLEKALELGIINEVHYWNYTRTVKDQNYMNKISNLKLSSCRKGSYYTQIFPKIENNTFTINAKASNDICININNIYEIVFGGFNNTLSYVLHNNSQIYSKQGSICNALNYIKITIKLDFVSLQILLI